MKIIKELIKWLKWQNYKSLLGIPIGALLSAILYACTKSKVVLVLSFIIITIISIIIIQIMCLNKYADIYTEVHKKDKWVDPEDLRGKSKNVDDLLDLDKELLDFFDKYSSKKKNDYFEKELNKQWKLKGEYFTNKAAKILSKMDNPEIMYGLLGTKMIKDIINVFAFFEPYTIDIDYLKEHPEQATVYYYELLMQIDTIDKNSINEYYYKQLMELNYFKEIERFILSQMSNKELLGLAKSSKSWEDKIYYYGFLKEDEKGN